MTNLLPLPPHGCFASVLATASLPASSCPIHPRFASHLENLRVPSSRSSLTCSLRLFVAVAVAVAVVVVFASDSCSFPSTPARTHVSASSTLLSIPPPSTGTQSK